MERFLILAVITVIYNCIIVQNNAIVTVNLKNKEERVPAIFVFGDSIVDTGNNNNITTLAKCNFPPYGRDFFQGKATGRFSNGRVPSDILAEAFGVKKLLPAYLDQNLNLEDLLTGVCFASGGNGYDPLTNTIPPAYSLTDQLNQLKEYKRKIESAIGEEKTEKIISKSIYIICTGTNDILNTYFTTPLRKQYDINSYTDFLVSSASSFYQEIYRIGGRRIVIFGVPAIGCVPSQRTIHGGLLRECFEEANEGAILFNSKLISAINSLNSTLSDANLVYLDIYNPLLSLLQNPTNYGFEVVNNGCCGTGEIEVTYLCTPFEDPLTCQDDTNYLFWDSFHPTEKAYETLFNIILPNLDDKF